MEIRKWLERAEGIFWKDRNSIPALSPPGILCFEKAYCDYRDIADTVKILFKEKKETGLISLINFGWRRVIGLEHKILNMIFLK